MYESSTEVTESLIQWQSQRIGEDGWELKNKGKVKQQQFGLWAERDDVDKADWRDQWWNVLSWWERPHVL